MTPEQIKMAEMEARSHDHILSDYLLMALQEIKRLKSPAGDFCQCCVENDCDCTEGVTWGD